MPRNGAAPKERAGATVAKTISLPAELFEEVTNAAGWLSGPPHYFNRSTLIAEALGVLLPQLRAAYNHGKPFGPPPRFRGLKRGRPSKLVP